MTLILQMGKPRHGVAEHFSKVTSHEVVGVGVEPRHCGSGVCAPHYSPIQLASLPAATPPARKLYPQTSKHSSYSILGCLLLSLPGKHVS